MESCDCHGMVPPKPDLQLLFGDFPGAAGERLVAALRDETPGAFHVAAVELPGDRHVGLGVERKLVARFHVLAFEAQLLELRGVVALIRADRHAARGLAVAAALDRQVEAAAPAAFPRTGVA